MGQKAVARRIACSAIRFINCWSLGRANWLRRCAILIPPGYCPGMRRIGVHTALMAGAALALAGCGRADSRSSVPEFMRNKVSEPPPEQPPPDVKRLVGERL